MGARLKIRGRFGRPGTFTIAMPVLCMLVACGSTQPRYGSASPPVSDGTYKVGQPYQINGQWYYPAVNPKYDEVGVASWYGPGFHGKRTANGEIYNQNDLTAAHTTLPMPSYVRVTNLENGRSLVLRVNDRGPFARGRIIDVSRRSAQLLGFHDQGTARVRVQIIAPDTRPTEYAGDATGPAVVAAPSDNVEVAALEDPSVVIDAVPVTASAGITLAPADKVYVQAGAFATFQNAQRLANALQSLATVELSRTSRDDGQQLYRVRLGPLASMDQADAVLSEVVSRGHGNARIVVD